MGEIKISSIILTKNEMPVGIVTKWNLVWRVLASGMIPAL